MEKEFDEKFLKDLEYHNLHTGLKMTYLDIISFLLSNNKKLAQEIIDKIYPQMPFNEIHTGSYRLYVEEGVLNLEKTIKEAEEKTKNKLIKEFMETGGISFMASVSTGDYKDVKGSNGTA